MGKKKNTEATHDSIREMFRGALSDVHARMLEDRHEEIVLVMAILRDDDGEHPVYHVAEYGDGEGLQGIVDFIKDCQEESLLSPGQSLYVREVRFSTSEVVTRAKEPGQVKRRASER